MKEMNRSDVDVAILRAIKSDSGRVLSFSDYYGEVLQHKFPECVKTDKQVIAATGKLFAMWLKQLRREHKKKSKEIYNG